MARLIRVFDGRFGRLQLLESSGEDQPRSSPEPQIVLSLDGVETDLLVGGERRPFSRATVLFVNPGEPWQAALEPGAGAVQMLVFQASREWLSGHYPALFGPEDRPFPSVAEPITPRIRQLADILAVEALHDQFLSHERLEFMLQELVFAIVETYLARRRSGARLWHGSPFADTRIRRALALLRARPNKELNMNELASQVGLSRSRFYDLFQLSTGRSPRAYLDLLCVETAIAKLSTGRTKIAEVSAALGFSAQSNFTRFFQHQVGIPPSEYRAALRRPQEPEAQG
jgi:AraC-like DNA-binding protein